MKAVTFGLSSKGYGNPLQYSCLGNPMDRGAWWATVHGVAERDTHDLVTKQQLKDVQFSRQRLRRQVGRWEKGLQAEETLRTTPRKKTHDKLKELRDC